MKIKVNDEDNKTITTYLNGLININKYENELVMNYLTLLKQNNNGTLIEIINKYYIEEQEYDNYKKNPNDYIKNNYKELLFINDNPKCKYQIKVNPHDTSKEGFVLNGTLVLKVNRIIDYNNDLKKTLSLQKKFDEYLVKIEKEIEKVINIPVKILCTKINVPIKKKG